MYIHIYIYIYIFKQKYIYLYICICIHVCVLLKQYEALCNPPLPLFCNLNRWNDIEMVSSSKTPQLPFCCEKGEVPTSIKVAANFLQSGDSSRASGDPTHFCGKVPTPFLNGSNTNIEFYWTIVVNAIENCRIHAGVLFFKWLLI